MALDARHSRRRFNAFAIGEFNLDSFVFQAMDMPSPYKSYCIYMENVVQHTREALLITNQAVFFVSVQSNQSIMCSVHALSHKGRGIWYLNGWELTV